MNFNNPRQNRNYGAGAEGEGNRATYFGSGSAQFPPNFNGRRVGNGGSTVPNGVTSTPPSLQGAGGAHVSVQFHHDVNFFGDFQWYSFNHPGNYSIGGLPHSQANRGARSSMGGVNGAGTLPTFGGNQNRQMQFRETSASPFGRRVEPVPSRFQGPSFQQLRQPLALESSSSCGCSLCNRCTCFSPSGSSISVSSGYGTSTNSGGNAPGDLLVPALEASPRQSANTGAGSIASSPKLI